MLKRYEFTFLLIIVLLVFSGCMINKNLKSVPNLRDEFSQTGGLTLPITNKPESLQVLTVGDNIDSHHTEIDAHKNLFTKTLFNLTGIEIKYNVVHQANISDKLKAMYASKMIPDIAEQSLPITDFENIILKDLVVPVDEYFEIMPNLSRLYEEDGEYRRAMDRIKEQFGKIYNVLSYDIARDINHGFLYRKDIFDYHGIKPWTNTEEFISALRKLKSIYPDSEPFVSKRQFEIFKDISASWGLNGIDFYYDEDQQKNLYGPVQPKFKELLDFFKLLYDEKLIDPHFLTSSQASWERKMIEDNSAFVTYDWIDRMDQFYDITKVRNPNYDLRFGYPIGPKKAYQKPDKMGTISVFISNNEKKELSLKLIDFFLSPAGMKLNSLGVEGESYLYENNEVRYLGFKENELVNINTLEKKYGLFNQAFSLRFDKKSVYYQFSERTQEAQELIKNKSLLINPFYPNKEIQNSKLNGYNEILSKLNNEAEIFIGEYILSRNNYDIVWNKWLKKAKELGVDTLINEHN